MTDEQLWTAYVAGDDAAFTELANRYRPALGAYADAKGLQPAAVAQAVLDAIAERPQLRDGWYFRPWLFKIANRVADRLGAV